MAGTDTAQGAAVPNRVAITLIVGLATLMQALDTTIANISLPYIQGSLAVNSDAAAARLRKWCSRRLPRRE
jgi:DHA2 family multidrug resistance protein